MLKPKDAYNNMIERLFGSRAITFTFQVTEDCNLHCTYCYQGHKTKRVMSLDMAKKIFDFALEEAKNPDSVLSYEKNKGIIFEYIGGEPMLQIDMIYELICYIETRLVEEDSPWLLFHRHSFSSNGTLYFTDKVQQMIRDFDGLLSLSITVDGCKELHDECRLFSDGSGSYDLAVAAALDQLHKYNNDATKITLSPYNIKYTSKAIINMLELGFNYIHANCVYEEGWTEEHAEILYNEMLILADYIKEHPDCYIAIFDKEKFKKKNLEDDKNWCGGNGGMIAWDADGNAYPCLRYMATSLGPGVKPVIVGNVNDGIYNTQETEDLLAEMSAMTYTSQSPKECLECEVGSGCGWCSAYNYQYYKEFNKRATFICCMHKAMARANKYLWG